MRPIAFSYSPSVLDADGIALSQTPGAAGNLTLNGVLASGGAVTLGDQQIVTIFSASDLSLLTFLVSGTSKSGNALTETVTGPAAAATVSTAKNFYTLRSIYISGLAAGALTVGVSGLGQSAPIPLNLFHAPLNTSVAVTAVTGATYKLQLTYDDVQGASWPNGTQKWFDHSTMTGKTAADTATLNNPATAVRIAITSASSPQSVSGLVVQSGAP